ncbi:metallophosphoesterase [Methylobacterium sp. 4-46]|uniref:metallophosphoesterase n=1 Tax=unclassified Methylobacterium TaxID=2615210 RepID=UPI000152D4B0|nr:MULTISPECIES: metallophosphoesterase [Methylobacterium]ACA18189.1 metallophosphoesterase [Methylobacterium sp. 4-46]WFT77485.1 metallophosphoesterase [Methylobacterium nodulans]
MLIMPSRRQVLTGAAGLAALGAGAGLYGGAVEPAWRLVVTPYAPRPANWPRALSLRIAALADFHVGEPWMSLGRVEEIVAATNALAPDLVLLLGDYPGARPVALRRVALADFAKRLASLRAPLGVHAVLGNHDWWDDAAAQARRRGPVEARRVLEAQGITVLENAALRLVKDGQPFWLAGLADQEPFVPQGLWHGLADIPGTLAAVTDDAPVILMAHEPDIFPQVPGRVALTLAGHTHGGQVRLLGHSPVTASRFGQRYVYGHVVENGRHLVVSGGLGLSRIPVRLGVPPEIVLVRLTGAAAGAQV